MAAIDEKKLYRVFWREADPIPPEDLDDGDDSNDFIEYEVRYFDDFVQARDQYMLWQADQTMERRHMTILRMDWLRREPRTTSYYVPMFESRQIYQ